VTPKRRACSKRDGASESTGSLRPSKRSTRLTVAPPLRTLGAWTPRASGESAWHSRSFRAGQRHGAAATAGSSKPDVLAPAARGLRRVRELGGESRLTSPHRRSREFAARHKSRRAKPHAGELRHALLEWNQPIAAAIEPACAGAIADTSRRSLRKPNAENRAVRRSSGLRTLLVHGASWRPGAVRAIEARARPTGHPRGPRQTSSRGILGLGRIEEERVLRCRRRARRCAGGFDQSRRMYRPSIRSAIAQRHTKWRGCPSP